MSNLSDKDIDRLSREAADFYEPDDSSLSWSKLEQKLIEQIPERPPDGFRFGRINPYIWGSAVVLVSGISFFTIKNQNYSQNSTQTIQPIISREPSSTEGTKKEDGNSIQMDTASSAHVADAFAKKNVGSPEKSNTNAKEVINNNNKSSSNKQKSKFISSGANSITAEGSNSGAVTDLTTRASATYHSQNSNPAGSNKNAGKKHSASGAKIIVVTSAAGSTGSKGSGIRNGINDLKNNNGSASDISKTKDNSSTYDDPATQGFTAGSNDNAGTRRNRNRISLPLVVSSDMAPGKVTGNDSLLNRITQSKPPIQYRYVRVNRSLNFGFAFGPDYTDAGGITNNQLGNNIGLTVGYYLTNKLSVNSGVFYTNKFFWAPGHGSRISSYANGPYLYGNVITAAAPPPIDYINGSTNMWELPLTLRYDFAKNEKTKFFVDAGLSSYFVMKQTYIYFFHNGMRPLAYKVYDNEQVNYWFKVANISFGFETEIGKGFSFQAEPFFKLPIKNMGKDNLKLNSYGFLLSFRYTPVLSRTKK